MKITAVTPFSVHPGWRKNWIFVKVETDAGLTGWGEAYSQYDRDRAVLALVEEIGRYVVGRDPFQIKHITQMAYHDFAIRRGSLELYSAISGIEQAGLKKALGSRDSAGGRSPAAWRTSFASSERWQRDSSAQ